MRSVSMRPGAITLTRIPVRRELLRQRLGNPPHPGAKRVRQHQVRNRLLDRRRSDRQQRPSPAFFISGTAACTMRTKLMRFCSNAASTAPRSTRGTRRPAGRRRCAPGFEPAVRRHGRADQALRFRGVADVGGERFDLRAGILANLLRGRLDARLVAAADHQVAALLREPARTRVSESAARREDERPLSLQSEIH